MNPTSFTFAQILFATLLAGVGSVWLAALFRYLALARYSAHLLSLAAGALLATAFLHLLPEAFEAHAAQAHTLFALLLAAVVFFFLLDKAELYHHGHEHCQHQHPRPHEHPQLGAQGHGSWVVLLGDSVHALIDGVLIAAAFAASPPLGWMTAASVLAHEVPHHMGDLIVLGQRSALLKVSLTGAVTLMGGALGYGLVDRLSLALPYALVIAASSFVYVALADLIPQLQRRMDLRQTVLQVGWLAGGMGLVAFATYFL